MSAAVPAPAATPAPAPAATLVIFGAMGDLAARMLVPALVNLEADGLIDDGLTVLGVSRGDETDDSLRERLAAFADPDDHDAWEALRHRITYQRGDFNDPGTYARLAERLEAACGGNAVFFLATQPDFFGDIVQGLADARLFDEARGFRRVVVEKPFGDSLDSARALNARLTSLASEEQIYRIDHFLGKETVRNILVARFGNFLIEAVWNATQIDHVQITAAQTGGVGTRGTFYDATGALRDMVPSHLFQLLAMIGMEPPASLDAAAVREARARIITAIRPPEDIGLDTVRGRYGAGEAGGDTVPAYADEEDVAPGSRTETFVALKLAVDTPRWAGVPFYLRTGKAMSHRDTEIVIVFKSGARTLFGEAGPPNRLVVQVQPKEAISFGFTVKRPGEEMATAPVDMTFCYSDYFDLGQVTGYETLLHDVLQGDPMLFPRWDEIEAGWEAVQPILDAWAADPQAPPIYAAGSAGPAAADALIARDGRAWHALG